MGDTYFWQGELSLARKSLEAALAIYNSERHSANALLYGQDPGVSTLCYLALTLAVIGEKTEAVQRGSQAIELAKSLSHPFSLSYALGCNTLLRLWLRDVDGAQEVGGSSCSVGANSMEATK